MASTYYILKNLISLLQNTLDNDLNSGIAGLNLTPTLPTEVNQLPTIVVSFGKIKHEAFGIGGIVEVKKQLDQDYEIVKAQKIRGEITLKIWSRNDEPNVLIIIDQAAKLINTLLEANSNVLRTNGVLQFKLTLEGYVESSEDEPVWLVQSTSVFHALGRRLQYSFIYEFIEVEMPAEGVLERIHVNEIWLDGNRLNEEMVIPDE